MTTNSPRVSVIIPAYNSAKYIGQALESVFAQTYKDYEIIVADDGSTDETMQVLQPYQGRITLLTLPHKGICATRNEAIRQSHGEFIALLDSDDIWEPKKLELQIAYLDKHPEFALVYAYSTNFTNEDEGSVALVKKLDLEGHIFKEIFIRSGLAANSTLVIRRSVFDEMGGYDESLIAMEDYELNLRIAREYPIGRVPESLLRRRIHPDSFYSSGYDNQYIYQLPVYEKMMSDSEVQRIIGESKNDYMSGLILKFIFKNLFDERPEFLDQKLSDLERYSPEKADIARQLVADNIITPEAWRGLVPGFDAWYDDVKHKAELYKARQEKSESA